MSKDRLFYTLALLKIPQVGCVNARKLIQAFGTAEALFGESFLNASKIKRINQNVLEHLKNPKKFFDLAEQELKFIEKNAIKVLYFEDADYPFRLRQCSDAPIILFYQGKIKFEQQRVISIIGTRNMTAYGRTVCEAIIRGLKPYNPIIISGLANGVDICAHNLSLECGLQTIACLGHGLNRIYPANNRIYVDRIKNSGGLMTEFWSSDEINPKNFVNRNRIIAGLSEAVIVIESGEKGGAITTAYIANGYNRDVFAVPGRVNDRQSMGCNKLISNQTACILNSAEEFIKIMNWNEIQNKTPTLKPLLVEFKGEEEKIYTYLLEKGKSLADIIALECNISLRKLFPILLSLEMKGVVIPLPGKIYEAI